MRAEIHGLEPPGAIEPPGQLRCAAVVLVLES